MAIANESNMKFVLETDHNYSVCNIIYKSTVTTKTTVGNFEVIAD